MKKVKILAFLAALLVLTAPARAYGSYDGVTEEAPRRIARCCPRTWGRWTWPGFCCPDADAPDGVTPDVPVIPDAATPDVPDSVTPDVPDSVTPDVPAASVAPVTPDASATPDAAGMSAYETEVVRLVNAERARYGLAALAADAELSEGARLKSRDMRDRGYFSHESPTYGTPFQMMKSLGIAYRTAGENIAYGYATPEAVVAAWMGSEGHRANILNASYTRLGVGYVADGHYWTQWFIG